MRKTILIIISIFFLGCENKKSDSIFDKAGLNKKNTYIVFRGTDTKRGYFAKDFNLLDSVSTHVGLMQSKKNEWLIYNVSDYHDEYSDFRSESLKDFLICEDGKVNYLSVWQIKDNNELETKLIFQELEKYKLKKINFDDYFKLGDSTTLYCSEFVNEILYKVNPEKFKFDLVEKKLEGVYKSYFRKDSLKYYPVDIFQFNNNITKKKEWFFN